MKSRMRQRVHAGGRHRTRKSSFKYRIVENKTPNAAKKKKKKKKKKGARECGDVRSPTLARGELKAITQDLIHGPYNAAASRNRLQKSQDFLCCSLSRSRFASPALRGDDPPKQTRRLADGSISDRRLRA